MSITDPTKDILRKIAKFFVFVMLQCKSDMPGRDRHLPPVTSPSRPNPPHPRPAQMPGLRHAPSLARPHPQSLGRRPLGMPLLQGHHETRPHHPPAGGNRKTPKACRRFGRRRSRSPQGEPAGGAGESNHGAHRTTMAGGQRVDCRRSALAMPPARSSSGSCFLHSPPKCGGSIPDDDPDLTWFNQPRHPSESEPDPFDQSPTWQPEEIPLGDGRTLVLEDS